MTYYDKSMNYLNEFFELTPVSTSDLSEIYVTSTTENLLNSLIGQQYQLTPSKVDFEFYQIKKTKDTLLYFSEVDSHYIPYQLMSKEQDIILVAIERTIGVVDCNSNRLFNELQLNQGVTASDLQNEELALSYELTKKSLQNFILFPIFQRVI